MAINVPTWSCPNERSVYNNGTVAIGPNLCLVGDSTADRAARLPTLAEVVTQFMGISRDKIEAKSYGGVAATPGDTAVLIASGAVARGDTVKVQTTASNFGKGSTWTTGAAQIVGIARTAAADGETFEVWLQPRVV